MTNTDIERINELGKQAQTLSESPRFIEASQKVLTDKESFNYAKKEPENFLRLYGISLPDGLTIQFFDKDTIFKPGPEFVPFTVELFNCRTYAFWVYNTEEDKWEVKTEEICFGIRLIPTDNWPPRIGPWVQSDKIPWFKF